MEDITDLVKKMIEQGRIAKERIIKESAIKGYNVLAIKVTTEYSTIEGGTVAKQKTEYMPFDSMETAKEMLKEGYEFYNLEPVREYMESEEYKIMERWGSNER